MQALEDWRNRVTFGALMVVAWLITQLDPRLFVFVCSAIDQAVTLYDSGCLMLAAIKLVAVNAFRAVLLYNGWFLLAEGFALGLKRPAIAWALPLVALPASYVAAQYLHPASLFHFGVPALLSLAGIGAIRILSHGVSQPVYRLAVQSALVASLQWLDLIPLLTPYGFGWGELSMAVKGLSELMDFQRLLNTFCGVCFILNGFMALLLTEVFVGYEKRIAQLRLLRTRERELNHLRHQQLQARFFQEVQFLVHDLKRPLTVVVGLADLLGLSKDPATVSHSRAILSAAEQIDQMISEIRDPSRMRRLTVEELLLFTLAQVRPMAWGKLVTLDLEPSLAGLSLRGNLIRLSRALVNLLDNAHNATGGRQNPLIRIGAHRRGNGVALTVEDNGPGFILPRNSQGSSWGSTGLGLAFVRSAVQAASGTFAQEERPGGGLCCRIWIPLSGQELDGGEGGEEGRALFAGNCG